MGNKASTPRHKASAIDGADEVASLKQSEERMRRIVEEAGQGVLVAYGRVLYLNKACAQMLGFAGPEEFLAQNTDISSLIHPDDLGIVIEHIWARIAGTETVSKYEFRLLRHDGSTMWVETHSATIDWDGVTASLSWLTDITARKAAEAESVRSREAAEQANRSKTQFLANMSHELRTPLNAILGFSEMIEQQVYGPIAPKYVEYARDIHKSGCHLLALVNDVLDLSKLEAGKLELRESEVSIDELAVECLALMQARAQEGEVDLSADPFKGLPLLRADARAVKQILLNFLSNAVKFTPAGGRVRLFAQLETGGGLRLSVSDTGIGMTAADIEVALSPFGQIDSRAARKHTGTGLGLPICRSLMELHGGELLVESRPAIGTTLTARFPAERIVRREACAG